MSFNRNQNCVLSLQAIARNGKINDYHERPEFFCLIWCNCNNWSLNFINTYPVLVSSFVLSPEYFYGLENCLVKPNIL